MRFQNVASFHRHLKEAFPDHLSSFYLLVLPEEMERRKLMKGVLYFQKKKGPSSEVTKLDGALVSPAQLQEAVSMRSLWSEGKIVLIDSLEKVKKSSLETFANLCQQPFSGISVIAGASSPKGLAEFLEKGKKEIILLDLSQEKPWERQSRLKEWVAHLAKRQNKSFSAEALALFFDQVGLDYALLEQETHKLSCYVGEKNLIEAKDVQAIGVITHSASLWQSAEALVWESKKVKEPYFEDVSALLSFIPLLRFQLQTGLKLKYMQQKSREEISAALPTVKPLQLEGMLKQLPGRPTSFFVEGLKALFELELKLKSSNLSVALLWEYFRRVF